MKKAMDNMETNEQDCVPIKLHFQKQVAAQIQPMSCLVLLYAYMWTLFLFVWVFWGEGGN